MNLRYSMREEWSGWQKECLMCQSLRYETHRLIVTLLFQHVEKLSYQLASKALLNLNEIVRITSATYMMADQIRSYPLRHGQT